MVIHPRVIPCLLLRNKGLVKTINFKKPVYLGDPINVVKILNEKEVDELIFLDIMATLENREPLFDYMGEIASECFMPLGYGGGIKSLEDIRKILSVGIEKVVINSYAVENPAFIRQAADRFGSSTIVVSMDVRKSLWGKYEVYRHGGRKAAHLDALQWAMQVAQMGAGEIMLNSIDRDGTMQGYDLGLIKRVTASVDIPVVACGGAGNVQHLAQVVKEAGASAAAAGSMFVFQGKHRAVLISYPTQQELETAFG
jgi:imidazole glycerol-phosphate synthase subunit HisF